MKNNNQYLTKVDKKAVIDATWYYNSFGEPYPEKHEARNNTLEDTEWIGDQGE